MVFKLVRIDTQEPSKIQLSIGKHIIGRGKFLHNDDTDKRVSRNHAELEVTGDTVTLKSLHQNPCFYIKKSTIDTHLLQQDCTVSLCHGDKFGLIPDHFWYEVLHCTDLDVTEAPRINENNENGITNGQESAVVIKQNGSSSETNICNENAIEPDRSTSPSLLTEAQEATQEYEVNLPRPSDENIQDDTRSPAKRSHSSREQSPIDTKRLKTEPADNDSKAGPSNGQQVSPEAANKVKAEPASPTKPKAPLRERCIYGASCYRRNPQHKAQFSHPTDSDWGDGDRGECPYGTHCRRTDPRHWQHHQHPPGVHPPDGNAPRPGKRQKRIQRQVSESDEDTPVDDLIVTGKRARKTINRQTWSGSESEGDEDPYKTDESDEWQPSSGAMHSQDFSQDL